MLLRQCFLVCADKLAHVVQHQTFKNEISFSWELLVKEFVCEVLWRWRIFILRTFLVAKRVFSYKNAIQLTWLHLKLNRLIVLLLDLRRVLLFV